MGDIRTASWHRHCPRSRNRSNLDTHGSFPVDLQRFPAMYDFDFLSTFSLTHTTSWTVVLPPHSGSSMSSDICEPHILRILADVHHFRVRWEDLRWHNSQANITFSTVSLVLMIGKAIQTCKALSIATVCPNICPNICPGRSLHEVFRNVQGNI